jgi:replication fork protection complex subunit Tof1/Swi1
MCIALRPSNDTIKVATFKNGHLRLLMTLISFRRLSEEDDPETIWAIPPSLSADQLKQSLELIKAAEFNPPVFDDGKEAEDFIRRKSAGISARKRAAYDDDSDNALLSDGEEEFLFPAGGPTNMKKSAALEALKKTRRRRRNSGSDEDEDSGISDEVRAARARARRERELEKLRRIKSDLYIHDSDEESNEESDRLFFEREEELRKRTSMAAVRSLLSLQKPEKAAGGKSSKRKVADISSDSDSDDENAPVVRRRRARSRSSSALAGDSGSDPEDSPSNISRDEATDTPLSSPHPHSRSSQTQLQGKAKRLRLSSDRASSPSESPDGPTHKNMAVRDWTMEDIAITKATADDKVDARDEDEDEDDISVPVARTRRRVTGGFIVDSSDEE